MTGKKIKSTYLILLVLVIGFSTYSFQSCSTNKSSVVTDSLAKYKDEIKWQLYLAHYNSWCSVLENGDSGNQYIPSMNISFDSIDQYDTAYWESNNGLHYLNPASDTLLFKPRFVNLKEQNCKECTEGINGHGFAPFSVLFIKSKNQICELHTFACDNIIIPYEQVMESVDNNLLSILGTLNSHSDILNQWLSNELVKRTDSIRKLQDTAVFEIIPYDSTNQGIFKNGKNAELTQSDLGLIEAILTEAQYISGHRNPDSAKKDFDLKKYKRQYVAIINSKGEKEVWVNCFCYAWGHHWKTHIVMVEDGGECFFNLKINLKTKRFYDFQGMVHA